MTFDNFDVKGVKCTVTVIHRNPTVIPNHCGELAYLDIRFPEKYANMIDNLLGLS